MLLALQIIVGFAPVYLIIGLIKPKWVLFWMKHPSRLVVSSIALLIFMGGWTGIAKLTLKPKDQIAEQRLHREESSNFELGR